MLFRSLYALLRRTDALITDYSSVYIDYLLTGKPIGFTIDDMADHQTGYHFPDPLELMPGPHMISFSDLIKFVTDLAESNDAYAARRDLANRQLNKFTDGRTAERIISYFKIT